MSSTAVIKVDQFFDSQSILPQLSTRLGQFSITKKQHQAIQLLTD